MTREQYLQLRSNNQLLVISYHFFREMGGNPEISFRLFQQLTDRFVQQAFLRGNISPDESYNQMYSVSTRHFDKKFKVNKIYWKETVKVERQYVKFY